MSKRRNRSFSHSSSGSDCMDMTSQEDSHSRHRESKNVHVSNINFKCTVQDITDEFSSAGKVTFVEMLKQDKRFNGCAVVSYLDAKMASRAIETLNRQEFRGRKLVLKEKERSNSRRREPVKKPRHENNSMRSSMPSLVDQNTFGLSSTFLSSLKIELPLVSTVFVANLGYDVSEKMLRDVFILAGNVLSCELFKDKEGNSKGFGVVDFEHPVESVQAISMFHNQTYNDRPLSVRMDRSDKRRDNKVRLPSGLKSIGMGLGVDGNPLKASASARPPMQALSGMSSLDSISGGLMVANQLNSYGGNMVDPVTSSLSLGHSLRGMADMAPRRMPALSTPRNLPELTPRRMSDMPNRNMSDGAPRGMSGMSSRGLDSSVGSSLGNFVRITNLPLNYTSDNLQKLLWNCGDVVTAEMSSKGSGIVRLRTERDAHRAVQMLDRQPMSGRLLSAQLL